MENNIRNKKIIIGALGTVILIVAIGSFIIYGKSRASAPANQVATTSPAPLLKKTINKEFNFSIKDSGGKEFGKIKYTIDSAELRDEILIKGQRAKAIQGKVFFILTLKVTNDNNKGIAISTRDYLRFTLNNQKEKLAADIHNDPVEVQAISTKYTKVGLAIDSTVKDVELAVGEIDGKKETIKINLRK